MTEGAMVYTEGNGPLAVDLVRMLWALFGNVIFSYTLRLLYQAVRLLKQTFFEKVRLL